MRFFRLDVAFALASILALSGGRQLVSGLDDLEARGAAGPGSAGAGGGAVGGVGGVGGGAGNRNLPSGEIMKMDSSSPPSGAT